MVKILHLYSDMTFTEKENKVKENHVLIDKINTPSFVEGQAIFKERLLPITQFWKKRRNLGLFMDGTLELYKLDQAIFHSKFGTLEDIQKYIAGEIAKTKSRQKPMELWQFIVIIGMLAGVILLELKIAGILHF